LALAAYSTSMAHPACFGSTPYTLSAATLDDPFFDFGYGLTRV
jgi:hypothetical protein